MLAKAIGIAPERLLLLSLLKSMENKLRTFGGEEKGTKRHDRKIVTSTVGFSNGLKKKECPQ